MNVTAQPPPLALLRQAGAFCLDVLFPPVCALCRGVGSLLCPTCAARVVWVAGPICEHCGRGLEQPEGTAGLCAGCHQSPPPLAQMRAALRYEEPASTLIHRLKYEGYFALGRSLAEFLITGWPGWTSPPDLIVPIPLHPRRRRRRGYNQSELLARPLAAARGVTLDTAALMRTRHTAPQVGLGAEARTENVRQAFEARPDRVRGRSVLLIDDVLTTGATMTAAAEALLDAGAANVSAYCLARVS